MSNENHFVIFRRLPGHCAVWLVHGPSIREAMIQYALEKGADQGADGELAIHEQSYDHPLDLIEDQDRAEGIGWEIRQLRDAHWEAKYVEVLCSEDPEQTREYADMCLPLLRQAFPRARPRAFVWYLTDGPLVTFCRRSRCRTRQFDVLARYIMPWSEWPHAREWTGTHDDVLHQLKVVYPSQVPGEPPKQEHQE